MAVTLEVLRKKMRSAQELKKVVDTMKALAGVNVGIFEKVNQSLAEYHQTIELGLAAMLRQDKRQILELLRSGQTTGGIGVVVFGSDQGMVGKFNDYLAEMLVKRFASVPEELYIWPVGERISVKLQDRFPIEKQYRVPDSATSITMLVGQLVLDIVRRQETGELKQLFIAFNTPRPGSSYESELQTLLPIDQNWLLQLSRQPWETKMIPQIYQNSTEAVVFYIREHIFVSLCRACANSLVTENVSRLSAMQRAEDNIHELLEELTLGYNQKRQSSITEELFDVIFGYDVMLKQKK